MNTPFSSMAWVFAGSFVGSFGAVFLKAGAGRLKRDLASVYTNWRLAAGIGTYLLSFLLFVQGLRKGELSVLYPLVSLGYLWTLVWSKLFFGEPLTRTKFIGLGLILGGIVILGLGNR